MKTLPALVLLLALNGCWLDAAYAKQDGKPSIAEKVQAVAKTVPVYGDLVAYAIGAVGTIFGLGTHVVHKKREKKIRAKHDAVVSELLASTTPPKGATV